MEDNQTLLMMVLKQHFRDRPQILDEALRIIKEYSSRDSTSEQYEKVSGRVCKNKTSSFYLPNDFTDGRNIAI